MNRLPSILSTFSNLQQIQSKKFIRVLLNHFVFSWFLIEILFNADVSRGIHITGVQMDILWRRNRRLPKNPTSSGPLTDLPDYSFVDGRPVPLGVSI